MIMSREPLALSANIGSHRITDITVGDFWGIKGLPKDAYKKGVSAILINSKKGEILLSAIDSQIQKEERSLSVLFLQCL